jgi:hypothetical protein
MKQAWSFDFSFGFAALFTKKTATKGHGIKKSQVPSDLNK